LWILGIVIVVIVGLVVYALGFINPGWFTWKVFDSDSVQLGVQQVLRDSDHIGNVQSVTCPPGEPVQPGETFACKVIVQGQPATVTINVQDAAGDYQVSLPR
jgi:hypothetical protein